jgi:hypothetical protein
MAYIAADYWQRVAILLTEARKEALHLHFSSAFSL